MADAYLKVKDNGTQGLALVREETDVSVQNAVSNLVDFNCYNILDDIPKSNRESHGITWTWSGRSVTAVGVATSTENLNIFSNANALPKGIVPGKTYNVIYRAKTIRFRVYDYSGGVATEIYYSRRSGQFKVPETCTGMIIRLVAVSAARPNETLTPIITERMPNADSSDADYLEDIEYKKVAYTGASGVSNIVYCIIPATYRPTLTLANDIVNSTEEHARNAMRYHSTVSVNAGIFNTTAKTVRGMIVVDGVKEHDNDYADSETADPDGEILYMTADGVLHSISSFTPTEDVMALNPVWAVQGWYPIVKEGAFIRSITTTVNPRSWIAQDAGGNFLVGVCDGRDDGSAGMSYYDIYNFIKDETDFDAQFVYNLDGGGSSSFVYRGIRVNRLVRGVYRELATFLSFGKKKDAYNESQFRLAYTTNDKLLQNELIEYRNRVALDERIAALET